MRNFLAVLVVWNLAFLLLVPRFTTSPGDAYYSLSLDDVHTVYIGLFLLFMLVLFPLSFLANRMVERMEVGRFFIKLGLYLMLCTTVWIFLDPFFTFGNEMIVGVVLFAITYELLGKLPQESLKKLVRGELVFSFVVASVFFFGFTL